MSGLSANLSDRVCTYDKSYQCTTSDYLQTSVSLLEEIYNLTDIQIALTPAKAWAASSSPYCRVTVHYSDSWFGPNKIHAHCVDHLQSKCSYLYHNVIEKSFFHVIGEETLIVECVGVFTPFVAPNNWATVYYTDPPILNLYNTPYFVTHYQSEYRLHSFLVFLVVPIMYSYDTTPRNVHNATRKGSYDDIFIPLSSTVVRKSYNLRDLFVDLYTPDAFTGDPLNFPICDYSDCTQILDTGDEDYPFTFAALNKNCICEDYPDMDFHHQQISIDEVEADAGYFSTVFSPLGHEALSLARKILKFVFSESISIFFDTIGTVNLLIASIIFSICYKFSKSTVISLVISSLITFLV